MTLVISTCLPVNVGFWNVLLDGSWINSYFHQKITREQKHRDYFFLLWIKNIYICIVQRMLPTYVIIIKLGLHVAWEETVQFTESSHVTNYLCMVCMYCSQLTYQLKQSVGREGPIAVILTSFLFIKIVFLTCFVWNLALKHECQVIIV